MSVWEYARVVDVPVDMLRANNRAACWESLRIAVDVLMAAGLIVDLFDSIEWRTSQLAMRSISRRPEACRFGNSDAAEVWNLWMIDTTTMYKKRHVPTTAQVAIMI